MEIRPSTKEFTGASGTRYTIRETNGDDDAIISNNGGAQDGSSMNKWIAGVVTHVNGNPVKLTEEQASVIVARDRMGIVFGSRIHSLSPIIKFIHQCRNKRCNFKPTDDLPYEEDLNLYFWDFKTEPPAIGDKGYSKFRIERYPNKIEDWIYLTLASAKKLRYKYLDGASEKITLDVPIEDLNKNFELLMRRIEMQIGQDKWQEVQNFKIFNSREMTEIRASMKKNDEPYDPISEVHCPKCKNIDLINLLAQPDFFFPTVI